MKNLNPWTVTAGGNLLIVHPAKYDPAGEFVRWHVITPKRESFYFLTKNKVKKWAERYGR